MLSLQTECLYNHITDQRAGSIPTRVETLGSVSASPRKAVNMVPANVGRTWCAPIPLEGCMETAHNTNNLKVNDSRLGWVSFLLES